MKKQNTDKMNSIDFDSDVATLRDFIYKLTKIENKDTYFGFTMYSEGEIEEIARKAILGGYKVDIPAYIQSCSEVHKKNLELEMNDYFLKD